MSIETVERQVTPRRARTRARLVDAARAVFARRGVVGCTVEEICEEAGYTRGAFYSNFGDKDELVAAVLTDSGERIVAAAEQAAAGPARTIDEVMEVFFGMQPEETLHFVMMTELTLLALRDPDAARLYLKVTDTFRDRVAGVLVRGLAEIGRECAVDPSVLVEALTGVFERSLREALLDRDGEDPHRLARTVLPSIIDALTRPRT